MWYLWHCFTNIFSTPEDPSRDLKTTEAASKFCHILRQSSALPRPTRRTAQRKRAVSWADSNALLGLLLVRICDKKSANP